MTQTTPQLNATLPGTPLTANPMARWNAALAWTALAAALVLILLLGVRKIGSPDIGYHLAYGEEFFRTLRPVDHNDYVFTLPQAPGEPDDLAPGCWYDGQGRYRFPNANWGTQVILAAVNTGGGTAALSLLLPALVAAIALLLLLTLRRLGIGPLGSAAAMLLVALTAYERFILRPEVFGYLLLVAQLYVLVGWKGRTRQIVALSLLQLVLVNLHSYFLLGLAITGAFAVDALVRSRHGDSIARPRPLLLTLAIQTAVCFVNPWTWRLAILPVQTLLFMREHKISGQYEPGRHPWSIIGEFFSPFGNFGARTATVTYCILLVLAGLAVLVLALRMVRDRMSSQQAPAAQGWQSPHRPLLAWTLVILGMMAVSLSMRRNIAPFAMVAAPLAVAALATLRSRPLQDLAARILNHPHCRWLGLAPATVLLGVAVVVAAQVPSSRLYAGAGPTRFGLGYSPIEVPLDACRFIDANLPAAGGDRIWCDYNSSSNVYYFTQPHRGVPLVTNTWAYPPTSMGLVLKAFWVPSVTDEPLQLADLQAQYGFDVVLLRVDGDTRFLAYSLARHADWAAVYVDARHLVFVRRASQYASRLPELELKADRLDVAQLLERVHAQDPVNNTGLYSASITLHAAGFTPAAIAAIDKGLANEPDWADGHNRRGQLLAMQANSLARDGKYHDATVLLEQAAAAFRKGLAIRPNAPDAKHNLELAEAQLKTLRSGRHIIPFDSGM